MEREGKYLDFEKPIVELEDRIAELEEFAQKKNIDYTDEIAKLRGKLNDTIHEVFDNLTPWQKVQLARHPYRPVANDYVNLMMRDFIELHGDKHFRNDPAIISGFARIDEEKVMVIGHQKGRGPRENIIHNYGSAHPEGYRKAQDKIKLAEKFGLPVISFIDTPGAYPGVGSEDRGIAMSIAVMLQEMSCTRVPIICVVIGEGGSGGALGIGVGDRLLMLENAYYSVILPEGCSAILWRDPRKSDRAAEALKLTAQDLLRLEIIDEIVPEPLGGAHRDYKQAANNLKEVVLKHLAELKRLDVDDLLERRYNKLRSIGVYTESGKSRT